MAPTPGNAQSWPKQHIHREIYHVPQPSRPQRRNIISLPHHSCNPPPPPPVVLSYEGYTLWHVLGIILIANKTSITMATNFFVGVANIHLPNWLHGQFVVMCPQSLAQLGGVDSTFASPGACGRTRAAVMNKRSVGYQPHGPWGHFSNIFRTKACIVDCDSSTCSSTSSSTLLSLTPKNTSCSSDAIESETDYSPDDE